MTVRLFRSPDGDQQPKNPSASNEENHEDFLRKQSATGKTKASKRESSKEQVEDKTDSAGLTSLDHMVTETRYSKDAQERIRGFRVRVDSLFLTAQKLTNSRAIALAVTAFQNARHFTGLMLSEKGAPTPYPESNDPNSPKIEPRTDKGTVLESVISLEGDIAQVKALRAVTADLITELAVYLDNSTYGSPIEFIAQNEVVRSVISGKNWLGERLGEIAGN